MIVKYFYLIYFNEMQPWNFYELLNKLFSNSLYIISAIVYGRVKYLRRFIYFFRFLFGLIRNQTGCCW